MLQAHHYTPLPVLEYGADPTAVLLRDDHQPGLSFIVLNQLRRRNQFCDVEIKLQGNIKLQAHKVVLASSSPYFMELLTPFMDKPCASLDLQELAIDVSAFEILVDFLYTSVLRITEKNVETLCHTARLFQLERIEKACCKFMLKSISATNCIKLLHFSHEYQYTVMYGQCQSYIAEHITDLAKDPAFLQLSTLDISGIVKNEKLNVLHQSLIEILMRWVAVDQKTRINGLKQLVTSAKFSNSSLTESEQHVNDMITPSTDSEHVFKKLKMCFEKFFEAETNETDESCSSSSDQQQAKAREFESTQAKLLTVGGITTKSNIDSVEIYDPSISNKHWVSGVPLPQKKSHAALVYARQRLYSIGGSNGNKKLASVDIFDFNTQTWTEGPPMKTARSGFGAVFDGKSNIYCIGGYNTKDLSSVEILDLNTNKWSDGPAMQQSRSYFQAAILNNELYAVGGTKGSKKLKQVEKLTANGQWAPVASLKVARSRPGVAALNGRLYAVGGYSGSEHLSSVESYDPEVDRWEFTESMSTPRNSPALTVFEGGLCVAGGHDGKTLLSSVERYDPVCKEWSAMPSMVNAKCDFGMTAIADQCTVTEPESTWT